MLYVYSNGKPVESLERDFLGELCDKAESDDIGKALNIAGYARELTIGDEFSAEIELYLANPKAEFGAIALLTLGGSIKTYAMVSFHDALDFIKEYTPTIQAIVELDDRRNFQMDEQRKSK